MAAILPLFPCRNQIWLLIVTTSFHLTYASVALYISAGQERMMAEPLTQTIFEKPAVGPAIVPAALSRLRSALPEGLRGQIRSARELDRELRDAAGEGVFPTAVPVLDR